MRRLSVALVSSAEREDGWNSGAVTAAVREAATAFVSETATGSSCSSTSLPKAAAVADGIAGSMIQNTTVAGMPLESIVNSTLEMVLGKLSNKLQKGKWDAAPTLEQAFVACLVFALCRPSLVADFVRNVLMRHCVPAALTVAEKLAAVLKRGLHLGDEDADRLERVDTNLGRLTSEEALILEGFPSYTLPLQTRIPAPDEDTLCLDCVAERWQEDCYELVQTLQEAPRNQGRVDLMRSKESTMVAVKCMPLSWLQRSAKEFDASHEGSSELPWLDIALIRHLNEHGFPYVCKQHGVFHDDSFGYVVSSFGSQGDLFGWCGFQSKPGHARESLMLPILAQVLQALRWLHDSGISHRDLSLENVLLTDDGNGGSLVQLIDFGMATTRRICSCSEARGKLVYRCPEMHGADDEFYDAFQADAFALGVLAFAMASQDYPWRSTEPGTCHYFEHISTEGFRRFLELRKAKAGNGKRLIDVFSPSLVDLMEGLLALEPENRFTLGEACWEAEKAEDEVLRPSVWDNRWLSGER
eukprot:TRINITY_DN32822_c0_g1_i1.p1 TRINITY_DN32822_c0_g1~~TRINITY_DN32822_c0_g1_i1.p1  ORF type:complete len:559 (-),score=108.08 TRINITY_DN32822_c0_g1_i1:142-1725(-)